MSQPIPTVLPAPLATATAGPLPTPTGTPTPPPIPIPQTWSELGLWLYTGVLGLVGTFIIDGVIWLHDYLWPTTPLDAQQQRYVSVGVPAVGILAGYAILLLTGGMEFSPATAIQTVVQIIAAVGGVKIVYSLRPGTREKEAVRDALVQRALSAD